MSKIILSLVLLLTTSSLIYSQEKVLISDTNFKSFLNLNYSSVMDISGDSLIIAEAAKKTGTFDCRFEEINDLHGIEYFTGISEILCYYNNLTELPDLSNLTLLTYLDCGKNELTNISQLPISLEVLGFTNNPISVFPNLSTNVALKNIYCSETEIESIPDLSANIALEGLSCYSNSKLTSLPDLSANVALESLTCYANEIETLPSFSENINLTVLNCFSNNLNSLPDLSNNSALEDLNCAYNNITHLPDLSGNPQLRVLKCSGNKITNIPDLSNNALLEELNCNYNNLEELPNLSANINLTKLFCSGNQLEKLPDLSNSLSLVELSCSENLLDSLPDFSSNIQIESLYCNNNLLTNLPQLPNSLVEIYCENNLLQTLPDLSGLTELETFECQSNQIDKLPDFSNNNKLYSVNIRQNKLDFSDAKEILIIDKLPDLYYYVYTPQFPFGNRDTVYVNTGENFEISISSQDSALAYQWFKNDVVIDGAVDTLFRIDTVDCETTGTYTCTSYGLALQGSNMIHYVGFSSFTSEPVELIVNDDCTVGIMGESTSDFNVYPNPTAGLVNIECEQIIFYEIYNNQGVLLKEGAKSQINLTEYENGYYFIKISDQKGAFVVKKILLIK